MDTSHYDNFPLTDHLGELVLSPTCYTSKFYNSHPNEVWVKGFFFMVPHEENGHYISPFDDGNIRAPYYLHLQQHHCLHFDYTRLHGCTYDVHLSHLSHLETHDFPCPFPILFEVGGTSSHTWVKSYMIEEYYYWQKHPLMLYC